MKPYNHSESSVKEFKGKIEDYMPLHCWMDATKEAFPDNRHRALRHHSFGIFEGERKFGYTITNSDGIVVSTRSILERHVFEDLGFIPTVADYLNLLKHEDWMNGGGDKPQNEQVKLPDIVIDGARPVKPKIPPKDIYDGNGPLFPPLPPKPFPKERDMWKRIRD